MLRCVCCKRSVIVVVVLLLISCKFAGQSHTFYLAQLDAGRNSPCMFVNERRWL